MEKSMNIDEKILKKLKSAYSVGVLTGAGISAASGVPTFRGENGIWKKLKPEELANFDAFMKNPELVWEWYTWRRQLISEVKPNLGHYALLDLEVRFPEFLLITQNVDNLHTLAGSRKVVELHGNIMKNKCAKCGIAYDKDWNPDEGIPKCTLCGGIIRPDIVWFGEMLPEEAIIKAQEFAVESEVFLSIGTSAVVEPAATLPLIAKGNGAYVIEINTDETPLTPLVDAHLSGTADKILPELVIQLDNYSIKS
ncbi:MAG: NAD-dependent deacylase [Calditrichia bacterium]